MTQPPPALTVEIDPRLLEILVCPVTHGPLTYDRDKGELISKGANLAYPIPAEGSSASTVLLCSGKPSTHGRIRRATSWQRSVGV